MSRGIIDNLFQMMPSAFLRAANVRQIVGTGTALEKNSEMQRVVTEISGLPLVVAMESEVGDAAVGAALAVLTRGFH